MLEVGSVANDVLVGKGGYLFLAGGQHAVMDFVSGRQRVADQSYEAFAANILGREEIAQARGIPYVHVVFPDKQSVLTEYFPLASPICLGDQYIGRLPCLAGKVLYPLALLRQAQGRCFLKTDTHMADFGIVLTTMALVEKLLGLDCRAHEADLMGRLTDSRSHSGDLGSKLSPAVSSEEIFLKYHWRAHHFYNKMATNNGLADIWVSPESLFDKRLLIFGDSFGRSMGPVLSFFFREIVFARTPFFHPELLDQLRPDCVVSGNVERYLTDVAADDGRPNFFMFPYLARDVSTYQPGPGFAEAFSAMLSYPRKPYADFIAKFRPPS